MQKVSRSGVQQVVPTYGYRDDVTVIPDGHVHPVIETLTRTAAHLAAATDLLRKGGKKAVASDRMFRQILKDHDTALRAARKTLKAWKKT